MSSGSAIAFLPRQSLHQSVEAQSNIQHDGLNSQFHRRSLARCPTAGHSHATSTEGAQHAGVSYYHKVQSRDFCLGKCRPTRAFVRGHSRVGCCCLSDCRRKRVCVANGSSPGARRIRRIGTARSGCATRRPTGGADARATAIPECRPFATCNGSSGARRRCHYRGRSD